MPASTSRGQPASRAATCRSKRTGSETQLFPDEGEETLEGFDGSFATDPEQAREILVDLVNQGQVFVAFGVLHFIDSDGANRSHSAMLQSPGDHVLDRVTNLLPRSMKRLGGFLPGELARPAGQKQHISPGQLVFAIAPRNLFHHHATVAAMDAPHAVQEENQKAPKGDELKTPLGKMFIPGRRLLATGADGSRALPWTDGHLDGLLLRTEAGMLVDKSPKMVAVV